MSDKKKLKPYKDDQHNTSEYLQRLLDDIETQLEKLNDTIHEIDRCYVEVRLKNHRTQLDGYVDKLELEYSVNLYGDARNRVKAEDEI